MKKRKNLTMLMIVLLTLLFSTYVSAAEPEEDVDLDEMMSMDLDDLLNMEVSVASKSNEKLSDAPGIVGVITRREIDAFGYKTLADILNRCTSMYFLGSDNFFFNQMNIRGMTPKQYDTHADTN